jgi:uncharacterized DUF497 family protein
MSNKIDDMKFDWNEEKNLILKHERNIGFEDIINAIHEDKILDIIKHPNFKKYPKQKIYIIEIFGYVYMVPFIKEDHKFFLKTIIPSRNMKKIYLKE